MDDTNQLGNMLAITLGLQSVVIYAQTSICHRKENTKKKKLWILFLIEKKYLSISKENRMLEKLDEKIKWLYYRSIYFSRERKRKCV